MKIDNVEWKPFKLADLFCSIYKAKAHVKAEYDNKDFYFENSIRFISRTDNNNGCDCYIEKTDNLSGIELGNAIVIGDTTASLSYQDKEFVCGDHMVVCRAEWINYLTAMFILTMLKKEKYKYSYGRAFKIDLIKDTIVWLPINEKSNIDWSYVESLVKSLKCKPISSKNSKIISCLNKSEWKEYKIGDLFLLKKCKCGQAGELIDGADIYYIGAKKNDNGVMKSVSYDNSLITKGNCIIFICDGQGSVGYANYMNKDFIGSTTLTAGYNPNLNRYNALFIVTLLDKERYKYSYGRKYGPHLSNAIIKLPTKNNEPDWQYMEDYIKSLPYADRI